LRCPPRILRAEAARVLPLPLTPQEAARVPPLPLTPQEAARAFPPPLAARALQVVREPGAAKEVVEEEEQVEVVEREGVAVAVETFRCSREPISPKPCRASYKR
jgi:hypothetical protein